MNTDTHRKFGIGIPDADGPGTPALCARSTGNAGIRRLSMLAFVDAQISIILFTVLCHLAKFKVGNQDFWIVELM